MPTRPLISNPKKQLDRRYSHMRMDSILHTKNIPSTKYNSPAPTQSNDARSDNQQYSHPEAPAIAQPEMYTESYKPQPHRLQDYSFDNITDSLELPMSLRSKRDQSKSSRYQFMPFISQRIYDYGSGISAQRVFLYITVIIFGLGIGNYGYANQDFFMSFWEGNQEVAQASEKFNHEEYTSWISISKPSPDYVTDESKDADPDGDTLTNYQEFLLQSNPYAMQSCANASSDAQALNDLINPGTCREVDWSNNDEVQDFVKVLSESPSYETFVLQFDYRTNPDGTIIPSEIKGSQTIIKPEQITRYISTINPTSEIEAQSIIDVANEFLIKPELLVSIIQYQTNFDVPQSNNVTGIQNSKGLLEYDSYKVSLRSTAQMLQYLNFRSVPDCAQLTLLHSGDITACSEIRSIYSELELEII